MHLPNGLGWVAAAAVIAFVLWVLGNAGRALVRMVLWGLFGAAIYLFLDALRVPKALTVSLNPVTVGTAALLGPAGVGLTLLAHALFP